MDISALLTKKAAIVGGSTAATTAVVVPVVVTQTGKEDPTTTKEKDKVKKAEEGQENSTSPENDSEKTGEASGKETGDTTPKQDENPPVPNFSAKLTISDDFYQDFKSPSDCITRLFSQIEKSPFFTTTASGGDEVKEATEETLFNGSNQANPPDIACYFYNAEQNKKVRLEIAIKKGNEGWVWMAGLKDDITNANKKKLWYREFIVTNESDNWKVKVGHEGEMPDVGDKDTGYQPQFPIFSDTVFPVKDINPETQEDCIAQPKNNCTEFKARVAYWKANGSGVEMVKLSGNTGHQVARWKKDTVRTQMYKDGHRKKLYKGDKWYTYKNPDQTEQNKKEILIKLEDSKAASLKGNWKDLARFCTTEANKEGDNKSIYGIFCK